MLEIIMRAGCFVSIILIGFILRRINFFDEHAFKVLSKIVVRITLPAAIVHSFIGKEINADRLSVNVYTTNAEWFGVTYAEDRPAVAERLANMKKDRVYPSKLKL